jgi:ribonuclease HII
MIHAKLIDDSDDSKDTFTVTKKRTKHILCKYYDLSDSIEIGIDESGRGPLFGRVYASAVVLPKDDTFIHHFMKDSKKFTSKSKIEEVAKYIKESSIAWSICYEDEDTIDNINILQATQKCMHRCILEVIEKIKIYDTQKIKLLIDGNYFQPIKDKKTFEIIPYITIEGGDNKYTSIAAASILAKVERDKYILELCEKYPILNEYYFIDKNKGYGTKKHLDGIKKYGITKWHRKTFGICKLFT